MDRRAFLGSACAGLAMLSGCAGQRASAPPGSPITILLNPMQMAYLPIFHALDHGYFKAEGLTVNAKLYTGSANAQLPMLARGDVELGGVIAGPALFNQVAQGFGVQLLCALSEARSGYLDGVNLMVRRDLWDARPFDDLSRLRGHAIDGAARGNPIDMLIRFALMEAGLAPDDVSLSYKIRSPSDVPYLFRERQVDLAGVSEPTATFIEQRGLARKWIGYSDVVPWYQDTFLGASADFAVQRAPEAAAFVKACQRAAGEIDASRGQWTPGLLATAAKWTKLKTDDLRATGKLPYWGPTGRIDREALTRVQNFWADRHLVSDRVDIAALLGAGQGGTI